MRLSPDGAARPQMLERAASGEPGALTALLRGSTEQRADLFAALAQAGVVMPGEAGLRILPGPQEAAARELVHTFGWSVRADGTVLMPGKGELERTITALTPAPSVPTQCVKVSAPDALYLAGLQMVPTHNTGKLPGEGKRYSPKMMAQIRDDAFFAMKTYALLVREQLGVIPDMLRLIFVKTGNREEGILTLPVTEQVLAQTRAELIRIWRDIRTAADRDQWDTQTGPLCRWCPFLALCPAYAPDPVAPDELPDADSDTTSTLPAA